MESHTQALSISSRVWKVILDTRLIVEFLPDTVLILEYFESSMGSCTQALSILSRVWKVILDTRLIVEYLPDTVLILEYAMSSTRLNTNLECSSSGSRRPGHPPSTPWSCERAENKIIIITTYVMQDSTLCPRQYLHAPLLCRGALCRVSH